MQCIYLIFFMMCVSVSALGETYDVNFRVININGVSAADERRIHEGIGFFNQLLQRQCGFHLNTGITRHDLILPDARFNFESIWSPRDIEGVGTYFFRFFQEKMFSVTTENNLSQRKDEVSIFVAPSLNMCGFAFPDVQLLDDETLAKNPDPAINSRIIPWIRNRVIIGATSKSISDCANSNRLIAHELAHIFVQDRSPHTCWNESENGYRGCPEENILATRRLIYPEPRGRFRPPGSVSMEEPEVRPATGTIITSHQCDSIRRTINEMRRF